jgi:hypothetical protein
VVRDAPRKNVVVRDTKNPRQAKREVIRNPRQVKNVVLENAHKFYKPLRIKMSHFNSLRVRCQ